MRRDNDPDRNLAAENDRGLNEAFYATPPFDYFNQRLEAVLLVSGKGEELEALLAQGIAVGDLRAGGVPPARDPTDERAAARERYIVAEATVLLHHTAETLLRLYLSHERLPPCPWLALAKETNFRVFKEKAHRLGEDLAGGQRSEDVAAVFFGARERTSLNPSPPAVAWQQGLENVAAWIGWFAQHFLDANVYNAAKHGLALRPGDSSVSLRAPATAGAVGEGEEILGASGPSLEYIEIATDDSGQRYWQRTTRWIDVGRSLAYVFMACRLIKALWAVAKARYTGARLESLDLFQEPQFEKTLQEGISTTGFSVPLLYYAEPGSS